MAAMRSGRRKVDPPLALTGSPQQQSGPSKPNRLSRSFRQTQQTEVDSPKSQQPDFKTPTRIPRSRGGGVFSGESPNNDSDFQQDIIWDATTPSPNRLGKRGKKHKPAVVVDISEIVNRIAPKHGRPKVAEPTLQQWIGDSAAIPCTPDVQAPKSKKKSPRPNGVDDLLKLAKQFDFNMFRQDEEDVEDLHQQSPELLFEDALDPGNDFSFSSPGNCRPATKPTAAGTDAQLRLDHLMDDDLDFLFDGPTQRFSGNLSQGSLAQPSSREASGKPADCSHGPTSGVTATHAKGSSAKDELVDEFEDDWDDDDLLNDSLVLEMTQNPQAFAAPKHSSTQKAAGQIRCETPAKAEVQPALTNVRRRTTFKLESNPNFSFKRIQTNPKVDYISKTANEDTRQDRFSSGNGISVASGSQKTWKMSNVVTSDPISVAKFTTTASTASATKTTQHFPMLSTAVSSHGAAPAVSGLLDGDLSSFLLSDPVWDDAVDDDLLCEMCEDLENQIQSGDVVSAQRTLPGGHGSNQRASPPPAARQLLAPNKPGLPCAPGRPAARPWTGGGLVSNVTVAKNTSSSGPTWSSWVPPAPRGSCSKDQFTFKKPNNPVSTATSKGKCSAAEIELKKQQAMEKRRQRLQATGNLRAPT